MRFGVPRHPPLARFGLADLLARAETMQTLARPGGLCMPTRKLDHTRQTRCHAYSDFRRLLFLPDGAWVFETNDEDAPVYGDSFVMHTNSRRAAFPALKQMHGLVPLKQRPTGVAVRTPQPSMNIVPLSLEDIEVSIVVLPAEETTGIVPFRQMLAAESSTNREIDPLDAPSSCLAIVPKDDTMLGIVMGSAIRRRDDDVQLPMVGQWRASYQQ